MSFRSALALALSLLLVLTTQTMAVARTAPGPAGSMVLCTGDGPVTVLVDETGAPMGGIHICPDCALGLFSATLPGLPELPRRLSHPCAHPPASVSQPSGIDGLFFSRARAPPLSN